MAADPSLELDDIDKRIVVELQNDGRVSYADLGPLVGLSAVAVRRRVQRLLDGGIMQIVGVTDPQSMGFPTMAMLGVQVDGDVRQVADAIAEIDRVVYQVMTSGGFDLFVEVICEDAMSLLDLINSDLKTIDGVRHVESFMYYGIHTHRFGWGVR